MQEACWQRWPLQRDREARVYQEKRGAGAGGRGGGDWSPRTFEQQLVRPGGSAHRRSTESPSSRAWLIGDDWAGRAYHRKWSRAEACRRTAARLRALRSTCAAQCNGAAGHHEGKVWRRRRRALGWAQGVCRAGRTIGGSTSRRDSWEGPADGNASSAPSSAPKNCVATKKLSGGVALCRCVVPFWDELN